MAISIPQIRKVEPIMDHLIIIGKDAYILLQDKQKQTKARVLHKKDLKTFKILKNIL